MGTSARKRSYSSPGRRANAERTRAAVLEGAHRAFTERGWDGMSMRDLAREVGVSVETIYASVGNKARLLRQAIDAAVSGETPGETPGEALGVDLSGWGMPNALAKGTRTQRVQAAARMLNAINERVGGLQRALEQGAVSEPELAEQLAVLRERQLQAANNVLRLVLGDEPSEELCRGVLTISYAPTRRLYVDELGHTAQDYVEFLARHFALEIQAHHPPQQGKKVTP